MMSSGASLGPYDVLAPLGRGGMGEVYLATDTRLDRKVAIKALPAHLASDPDRLARFQREAKVLASLNHPNIAAIHGLEESGGHQYLVLEYVEGQTLAQRVERGPIPIDEALPIARQIAEALEAAHEKGVVHRDLKPGNVMVTPDGAAKVLDFGLARVADASPPPSTGLPAAPDSPTLTTPMPVHSPTIPGVIMGTVGYMSPEQARGRAVDKRSDIFSFGCVLYEMLSGAAPFRGETATDAIGAMLHREPDWSTLQPGTPTRVRELLEHCLAKDRKQRLHDIGDARLELQRSIQGHEWAAPSPVARARPSPARLALTIAGAAALVAATWMVASRTNVTSSGNGDTTSRWSRHAHFSIVLPESPRATARFALSPDGTTLAYVAETTDARTGVTESHIWLRRLTDGEPVRLEGTDGAISPVFSPDGAWLAYVSDLPDSPGGRLRKVSVSGGPSVSLYEERDRSIQNLAWPAPDLICFGREGGFATVLGIGADGGPIRTVLNLDDSQGSAGFMELDPVPASTSILLSAALVDAKGWRVRTYIGSPGAPAPRVLIEDGAFAKSPIPGIVVYAAGDALFARHFDPAKGELTGGPVPLTAGLRTTQGYAASDWRIVPGVLAYLPGGMISGHRTLALLDLAGKHEPLSKTSGDFESSVVPSPDGKRIAGQWATPAGNYELFVFDIAGDQLRRLPTRGADCSRPAWSRDGVRLYYGAATTGQPTRILERRADGSDTPRTVCVLAEKEAFVIPTGELPDDGGLVFQEYVPGDPARVNLLRVAGGPESKPTPLFDGPGDRFGAALSPDGRWIVYMQIEAGASRCGVRRVPTGAAPTPDEPAVIPSAGDSPAHWSFDGKSILFSSKLKIYQVDVTTEPALALSPVRQVGTLTEPERSPPMPMPDGKFITIQPAPEEQRVTRIDIITNWEDLLSTRAPSPARR